MSLFKTYLESSQKIKTTNLKSDKLLLNLFWKSFYEYSIYSEYSGKLKQGLFKEHLKEMKINISNEVIEILKNILIANKNKKDLFDFLKNQSNLNIIKINSILKKLNETSNSNNENILTLENLAIKCKEQGESGLNKIIFLGNLNMSIYFIKDVLKRINSIVSGYISQENTKEILNNWQREKNIDILVSKISSILIDSNKSIDFKLGLKKEVINYTEKYFKEGYKRNDYLLSFFSNTAVNFKHWSSYEIEEVKKTFF